MIVCVGHTPEKFKHLLSLVGERDKFLVFNGPSYVPANIHTPNDSLGRDVAMYKAAIDYLSVDRAVFLNDDVQYLSPAWWRMATTFMADPTPPDIVGVSNLASWCDHSQLNGWQKYLAEQQGKEPLFIRTSAFMATREWFNKLIEVWAGDAQKFEKATLKGANKVVLLAPRDAYDSNTAPYV